VLDKSQRKLPNNAKGFRTQKKAIPFAIWPVSDINSLLLRVQNSNYIYEPITPVQFNNYNIETPR
jgi:hypothetical protein